MYKTEWYIETEEGNIGLFCYHFGKRPYFSPHFLEKDKVYVIEKIWTLKLVNTPKIFFKCLFHKTYINKKEK